MWNGSSEDGTLNMGRFRQCIGMCLAEEREREEHIKKVSSANYTSSPGKMQARSEQSCEAASGVKVCGGNELERLIEAVL